jgi:rhodanese-related sulfurtransferase
VFGTYDHDAVLLDVREPGEFAAGHAPGALHIPLGQLPERLGEIPAGPIVVTCKMGGRASKATAVLRTAGRDAVNLQGGMREWADSGRPMVSERGGQPEII